MERRNKAQVLLLAVLAIFCLGSTTWAEGSAVPGRAVGHVFLGMDRADVWKILRNRVIVILCRMA